MMKHAKLLIIGGGNAGISLSAYLKRHQPKLNISIVEPSERHYYQPAWTLVGGGVYDIQKTVKREADVIPKGVEWIRDYCESFDPENNQVSLRNGEKVSYDYLVVCPGIQLNWSEIKGLKETLGKNGVCSNYSFETAPYTFDCIKSFKGGVALFHNPHTPVKCGGAPHKIMYLAADFFRRHGVLEKAEIHYWSGSGRLFSVPKYENTLLRVVKRGRIQLHFNYKLTEVDGERKEAVFEGMIPENKHEVHRIQFDMIHVTPPQSAPDFVKKSPLANEAGWVDVDIHTLQHKKYPNIFSLGDCAALPTSKTGAAIRKQMPVVAQNLMALMQGEPLKGNYDGYTSCPLVTGYGKLVLAEFDYQHQPKETFPFDQSKERWSMYQLKKEILPRLYWGPILHGKI
ncbi:MAG: NAD(P)/FAD-dependent oxidoreductase [Flavobacteriales bacterium]|nr:NAD(P)/FAD-dependent oxidoreductase [Flavobacteriales bacterium]